MASRSAALALVLAVLGAAPAWPAAQTFNTALPVAGAEMFVSDVLDDRVQAWRPAE